MRDTYKCRSCGAHFRATRMLCSVCGTEGEETDRETCIDCGIQLTASPYQQCPLCGSEDVEDR